MGSLHWIFWESKIGTSGNIRKELLNVRKYTQNKALNKTKNPILFFDDVERCKVDIGELLGFFDRLTETIGCNVILVSNEKEIEDSETYWRAKEKVGRTRDFFLYLNGLRSIIL